MDKGTFLWFTGVPASGKSTIGRGVEKALKERGIRVENLDADEIRANLSPDLGYTAKDRDLNTKRLAFMGKILTRNGVCSIVAAVSPLREHRDRARKLVDNFLEVHVMATLDTCKHRDPKGLYKRAERGEIADIAGWHMRLLKSLRWSSIPTRKTSIPVSTRSSSRWKRSAISRRPRGQPRRTQTKTRKRSRSGSEDWVT